MQNINPPGPRSDGFGPFVLLHIRQPPAPSPLAHPAPHFLGPAAIFLAAQRPLVAPGLALAPGYFLLLFRVLLVPLGAPTKTTVTAFCFVI